MHPWEDRAETWAHFRHIADGLNTAIGFRLEVDDVETDVETPSKPAIAKLPFVQIVVSDARVERQRQAARVEGRS